MASRLPHAALLLAALLLPASAFAHHEGSSTRYLAGFAASNSVREGSYFCVEQDLEVHGFEGCVLAAPDADGITIGIVSDVGWRVGFSWRGFTDAGASCGHHGLASGSVTVARPEGCTHYGVAPIDPSVPGTISIV